MARPVYPSSGNTRAFRHLRFVPLALTGGSHQGRPLLLSRAVGVFLFKFDLRQHRLGDVGAGLCVVDEKILAPFHPCRELIERHKGEGAAIVEVPVRVFLDDGGAVRICHRLTPGTRLHCRGA
jgi:hypothetical protein